MPDRAILLTQLDDTVVRLLDWFHSADSEVPVYEAWNAKDVLGHLTFWHESFARNVFDLANGIRPSPLKGRLRDLNPGGVEEMRKFPLDQVLQRFESAQQIIRENILNPGLTFFPYRKGSRDYSPEEHLEIVKDHIQMHLQDIQKATKSAQLVR